MTLSAEDQQLIASMRQREFSIKKRQRAANAIFYESRRYRWALVVLVTVVVACVVTGIFAGEERIHYSWLSPWRAPVLLAVISVVVGPLLAQSLLRTNPGKRLLVKNGLRLNRKYTGDLHAGRKWMQFYYQGEDISYYVPQILYVIESEHRFESVQAALDFVKQHHHENAQAQAHELQQFNAVAAQTNLVVLSSVNAHGQPSSRVMRFVKAGRPGVWYVATAPDTPKVRELDAGKVAVITVPTEDGAIISSNHVRIRRAGKTLMDVADLYQAQAPGYLDGMTEEDLRIELVYELTLQSAKVDSWASDDLVSLREPNKPSPLISQLLADADYRRAGPRMAVPAWLSDAVLYQIYPQSFADSDGDGIGDLRGIAEHLDYLAWLGVTAVWLSPCFVSPMRDAGYDVADHLTIDPRYGDNDGLAELAEKARARGIRLLLDLVAGHTADTHPWFAASAQDEGDHRYIWAAPGPDGQLPEGFVRSPGRRPGGYLPNFFDFQPALNFGYARQKAGEPWRQSTRADGPRGNRAALLAIADHWLRLGVSGFRADMAFSLVKDDPGFAETARLWSEVRGWLDRAHPDAVLLSEWGDPAVAVPAGFHADFFLQFGGPGSGRPLRSLWSNGTAANRPEWGTDGPCFFEAGGGGSAGPFLAAYWDALAAIGEPGHVALPTANHDFARLCAGPRTPAQLPAAFAFLLTFPALPAIYYGDEIGMRHLPGLPDTEGSVMHSGYNRAGARTPMQWDSSPNAGFSAAPATHLYLPADPDPQRPTVTGQHADQNSLLHTVRNLIALRRAHPEFGPGGSLEILHDAYPLAYLRGGKFLVIVNPSSRTHVLPHDRPKLATVMADRRAGISLDQAAITAGPFSFGIFQL